MTIGGSSGSDCGWVDWVQGPGSAPPPPDLLAYVLDSDLSYTTGGHAKWYWTTKNGRECARSGSVDDDQESWMQTTVDVNVQETVTFDWRVSSEEDEDYLEFYIDDVRKDRISGQEGWEEKSFNVTGQGSHTLKWRYVKDGSEEDGTDCGWVDNVQWSGFPEPIPDPAKWDTITYKLVVSLSNPYDPHGRRIEKSGNGEAIKYSYDGDHVVAEYDGNDRLLRKYIYGARVDEPVCMIDVADSNAVYYYHFDGLGSVVALSDSDGDSVQSYEYTVYGQVAAEDPDHPNPYMFTGRRFDIETGLYYYRARYYNPHIGRFMQTDPVGYDYVYCGNNPLTFLDPSGLYRVAFYDPTFEVWEENEDGEWVIVETIDLMEQYANDDYFDAYYPMNSAQDVLDKTQELQDAGIDVTEVYFYDHSFADDITPGQSNGVRLSGLEFGDEELRFDDGSLEAFGNNLQDILGTDVTYNFRACDLGRSINRDHLSNLASYTGGTVTAVCGRIYGTGDEEVFADYFPWLEYGITEGSYVGVYHENGRYNYYTWANKPGTGSPPLTYFWINY